MFLTDYIKVYENAIPNQMCDDLIQRFQQCAAVEEIRVPAEDGKQPDLRSYLDLDISTQDGEWKDIQGVLMKLCELIVGKYTAETPNKVFPADIGCEHYRLRKYRSAEEFNDHYAYHVDVSSYGSARRFMSIVWYLNDVEKGGDTFFPHPNVRVKPKQGRVAVFPSMWMYPHVAERPISNDKYIITTFLHYV